MRRVTIFILMAKAMVVLHEPWSNFSCMERVARKQPENIRRKKQIGKDMSTKDDLFYLRDANEVAKQAKAEGNTPFGAILVGPDKEILLRQGNIEITEHDCTGHAETTLVRNASRKYSKEFLWQCTLYSTFEPCSMCCGAIYWGNIGRVVFGTTEKKFLELTGDDEQNPTFDLPCRDIFARGQKEIKVEGPFPEFEAESVEPHVGYWHNFCCHTSFNHFCTGGHWRNV